jgi:2-dehydropantoate 2-reductase
VQNVTAGRNMLVVGAPDDRSTPQVEALRKTLIASDLHSPPCRDIREAVWSKLLLNFSTGTLCLLSGGTVAEVRRNPGLAALNERIGAEGLAIALAHGVDPAGAPPRPGGGHSSGQIAHKPSLIQDYELGRPMEVEAQLAAPLAFARAAGVAAPTLEALVALVAYRAAAKGLYPA